MQKIQTIDTSYNLIQPGSGTQNINMMDYSQAHISKLIAWQIGNQEAMKAKRRPQALPRRSRKSINNSQSMVAHTPFGYLQENERGSRQFDVEDGIAAVTPSYMTPNLNKNIKLPLINQMRLSP